MASFNILDVFYYLLWWICIFGGLFALSLDVFGAKKEELHYSINLKLNKNNFCTEKNDGAL